MTDRPSIAELKGSLQSVMFAEQCNDDFTILLAALDELAAYRESEPVLIARAENEALKAERDNWIATGKSVEDASLRAENEALKARVEALEARVDDLSMLVRQLVHSLNKYNPGSSTATRAMDYLHRNCLQGSILRSSESQDAHDARVRREALGTSGVEAIAAERKRQMEVEGWTPEHDDDEHGGEQLAAAASAYLLHDLGVPVLDHGAIPCLNRRVWPWGFAWWKPKSYRKNLIRAGALIAAEIDRMDRAAAILGPEAQDNEREGK